MSKTVLERKAAAEAKITFDDARLDPFGIRVHGAPLRQCGQVRWDDETVVMPEPGTD
jgi:hypothetical protein